MPMEGDLPMIEEEGTDDGSVPIAYGG